MNQKTVLTPKLELHIVLNVWREIQYWERMKRWGETNSSNLDVSTSVLKIKHYSGRVVETDVMKCTEGVSVNENN